MTGKLRRIPATSWVLHLWRQLSAPAASTAAPHDVSELPSAVVMPMTFPKKAALHPTASSLPYAFPVSNHPCACPHCICLSDLFKSTAVFWPSFKPLSDHFTTSRGPMSRIGALVASVPASHLCAMRKKSCFARASINASKTSSIVTTPSSNRTELQLPWRTPSISTGQQFQ